MSLQFVIGASGAGKSGLVYDRMIERSEKNPQERFMLLVPEQASLTVQQKLIGRHPRHGLFRIEVMSFSRLAYHVFDELKLKEKQLLDENGKSMILRRVIARKRRELQYFGGSLDRKGFVRELKSVMSEFLQCRIDADTLGRLGEDADAEPLLQHKLKDLQVICGAFREALAGEYTTAEEQCELLARVAGRSERIRQTHIVVEDFNGFTPVQYRVLEELMQAAPELTVVVTMRPEMLTARGSEYELFAMSRTVVERLGAMAKEHGIAQRKSELLYGTRRFAQTEDLAALEAGFDAWPCRVYEEEPQHIQLSVMQNPEEEVRCALEEILHLVRNGYCCRDIAVVTGNLEVYGPLIRYYFEKAGLPLFVDEKTQIQESPAIRFVSSALAVAEENFSYESVFRFLKCGLISMDRGQLDRVENYVLALGIRGRNAWEQEWKQVYRGLDPSFLEEYNGVRKQLAAWLGPFCTAVKEKEATVAERLKAVTGLLETFGVEEKLTELSEEFRRKKDFAREMEYSQSYEKLTELFCQLEALMGDETVSFPDFADILDSGFEDMQVGILPPTLDRLVVGDLRRTRLGDIHVMLILGANEGKIPFVSEQGGILTEPDRIFFQERQVELAASSREDNFHQRYYLYLALTKASDLLFISCSRAAGNGQAMRPSELYADLHRIFPRLTVQSRKSSGILTPDTSTGYLAEGLRVFAEGGEDPCWRELFSWYRNRPEWKEELDHLLDGAFYVYQKEKLNGSICTALYGEHPVNSVTRLESFASCEYAHFLTYGLGLRPRQMYELQAADFGNVYHSALDFFFREMEQEKIAWPELTDEKRHELAERSVRMVTEEYANTIFMSSAKNRYLTEQILAVTDRTVWALGRQLQLGSFVPAGSELQFTAADGLEAMQLMTEDGRRVSLAGRIDRIDLAVEEDCVYVRVVDYKSGSVSLDYTRVYYGLQLQLALYMGAALELVSRRYPGKKVIPAGIFYYTIQDPMIDAPESMSEEELDAGRMKELRLNGLVSSDPEVLSRMEKVRVKQSGLVRGLSYEDGGNAAERSGAVNEEQLKELCAFAKKKAAQLSSSLYRGEIRVNPYEYKGWSSCTYCPYRAVCGFDSGISGYRSRRFHDWTAEDFWERIGKENGKEEQDGNSVDRKPEESH